MDAFGSAHFAYASTRLRRPESDGWLTADVGVNAYQGFSGAADSYNAFSNGDYAGGTLAAAGSPARFWPARPTEFADSECFRHRPDDESDDIQLQTLTSRNMRGWPVPHVSATMLLQGYRQLAGV